MPFYNHLPLLVLFPGLRYNDLTLGPGAQTIRPGQDRPVSDCSWYYAHRPLFYFFSSLC